MGYKIKTKKAASKRFKITGSGKVLRYSQGRRHLLAKKDADTMRNKRGTTEVTKSDIVKVKRMLPGI